MASNKAVRLIAFGAFAAAAAAGPIIAASITPAAAPQNVATGGQCLAWFGNKDDGHCLGVSNGQPIGAGTPWGPIYGPNNYSSGPLLPGQTWSNGVN